MPDAVPRLRTISRDWIESSPIGSRFPDPRGHTTNIRQEKVGETSWFVGYLCYVFMNLRGHTTNIRQEKVGETRTLKSILEVMDKKYSQTVGERTEHWNN